MTSNWRSQIAFSLSMMFIYRLGRTAAFLEGRIVSFPRARLASHLSHSKAEPIPITLLSGFLGTGKTTTLKHLLENRDNVKVGVIVNDVASVNIDAKLVKQDGNADAVADGMVELQNGCLCCSLADELFFSVEDLIKGRDLDCVVVELSGVADPQVIRKNWEMAPRPIQDQATVSKVVTVVDASTFGVDYMSWDEVNQRPGWADNDPGAAQRNVAELLVEQVEAADIILLNKLDMATVSEVETAKKVVEALNEKAEVRRVEFGRIEPKELLGNSAPQLTDEKEGESPAHDHTSACSDPECTDESHSHSHDHSSACSDPECSDESHSHSHDHTSACSDPECTDESHSHSHQHDTSVDSLGLSSFVYRSDRPFESNRLMDVLNCWPVPVKDTLDLETIQGDEKHSWGDDSDMSDSPFNGVLRSKGFCWFAPNKWTGAYDDAWRHDTAMFWSHAGKSFGLKTAGKWWGTITKEQMAKYFPTNKAEYERILKEEFVSEEFGDRRQEIVFIGVKLDRQRIEDVMNGCLLTDEEFEDYRKSLSSLSDSVRSSGSSSKGLFDLTGTEHAEA